jgi:acetyl-CoA carboxylase carboxyltransferase component
VNYDGGVAGARTTVEQGGAARYHEANAARGKLFARERVRLLVDKDTFVEDGMLANAMAGDLPADGVVAGQARIDGRPV